jgi:hypothetical protein
MSKKLTSITFCVLLIAVALPAVAAMNAVQDQYSDSSTIVVSSSLLTNWTIMVYMAADNNLEWPGIDDFLEMALVGSTGEVNIVVQFDRIPGYTSEYGNWTTTKRYLVTAGMVPDAASALEDIGEANMGDPQTVIDFGTWAMGTYPADQYCFVFWDHGFGWKLQDDSFMGRGVCYDETDRDALMVSEVRDALNTITDNGMNPIDLIGFDACLMQMIEIGYAIADYGGYITASEDGEPLDGWSYDEFLASLIADPSMSPKSLGAEIVATYVGPTLSTVNLTLLDSCISDISDLGVVLQDDTFRTGIYDAMFAVDGYYTGGLRKEYVDLYHLIQLLKDYIVDIDVDTYAQLIMDNINNSVTSKINGPGRNNSNGISIYAPSKEYDHRYGDLLFSLDSQWDEFLVWYNHANPPAPPTVTGPTSGRAGVSYDYTFVTSDPDDDDVKFYIDWGDNHTEKWIGPYASGEEVSLNHTWVEQGTYTIQVKAEDKGHYESNWSTLEVSMPKNTPYSTTLFQRFLENHPYLFLILKLITRILQ